MSKALCDCCQVVGVVRAVSVNEESVFLLHGMWSLLARWFLQALRTGQSTVA